MNEFLNSFAFEQMAREYSKKYRTNRVEVLSILNEEYFEKEVTKVFDDFFILLCILKNAFNNHSKLKNYFEEVEELKIEAKQTYKNLFLKEYEEKSGDCLRRNINYKLCIIEMIEVIKNIFMVQGLFENKIFLSEEGKENKEKDIFLFKELQKIFEKIINCFKEFFIKI